MGAPRKDEDLKKKPLNIKLQGWLHKLVKEHPGGANRLIERLLEEYFSKNKK